MLNKKQKASPRLPEFESEAKRTFLSNHTTRQFGRKFPPYARNLVEVKEVIIVTGSDAWNRAASKTWFPGQKVLLPFGDNPERYSWPTRGLPSTIFSFGLPETHARLVHLSVTLIEQGATRVIWACGPTPATIFLPRRVAA